jgi:hypothetical protein
MHYFRQNDFPFLEKMLFQTRTKKRKTCSGLELTVMPHFAKYTTCSSGNIKNLFKKKKDKISKKYA